MLYTHSCKLLNVDHMPKDCTSYFHSPPHLAGITLLRRRHRYPHFLKVETEAYSLIRSQFCLTVYDVDSGQKELVPIKGIPAGSAGVSGSPDINAINHLVYESFTVSYNLANLLKNFKFFLLFFMDMLQK